LTHDDKRNGTTTLFAALPVAEGRVIGECSQPHRHQEFLRFRKRLDGEFAPDKERRLILDNYGTHGTRKCGSGWSGIPASSCPSFPPVRAG
jgi:hypothetical protein